MERETSMRANRSSRNKRISKLLSDGGQLRNFYRFTAQNPQFDLHDACQIILARPDASVCFYIDEWNSLGRRVIKSREGIAFYDIDGEKQHVFDVRDTHGDMRYRRLIFPLRRLLYGLDELNGTELAESNRKDYNKILSGVAQYLDENGYFTADDLRNSLIAEGVAYSLYSKTGFPKEAGIAIRGLPYGLEENARLFKEIYLFTDTLREEISSAYERRLRTPRVIDDIEEETISDEPVLTDAPPQSVSEAALSALEPQRENQSVNPVYARYMAAQQDKPEAVVTIRVGDFYEVMGERAREVSEWLNLTLTSRDVGLSDRVPMCGFPYHVTEQYLQALLEHCSVCVLEPDAEPICIHSHAASAEQEKAEAAPVVEAQRPMLTEIEEAEANPFDEEEESEDEPNEADWEEEQSDSVSEEAKSESKKDEKGIRDRKRKQKPQMSLFDIVEPEEKSEREKLIERTLQY